MIRNPAPGDWLRERLSDAGITPPQLAARLGIAPKRVYDWIRGDGSPNDENARLIAEQIGVSETELRRRFGLYVSPEAAQLDAAYERIRLLREQARSKRERELIAEIEQALRP
jgi:transcriptional regulator with XRE-family HTH domain